MIECNIKKKPIQTHKYTHPVVRVPVFWLFYLIKCFMVDRLVPFLGRTLGCLCEWIKVNGIIRRLCPFESGVFWEFLFFFLNTVKSDQNNCSRGRKTKHCKDSRTKEAKLAREMWTCETGAKLNSARSNRETLFDWWSVGRLFRASVVWSAVYVKSGSREL